MGSGTFAKSGVPLTEDITPGSGDRYYLVTALNPVSPSVTGVEGSYGRATGGAERPVGSSPCRPVQGFDCP